MRKTRLFSIEIFADILVMGGWNQIESNMILAISHGFTVLLYFISQLFMYVVLASSSWINILKLLHCPLSILSSAGRQ